MGNTKLFGRRNLTGMVCDAKYNPRGETLVTLGELQEVWKWIEKLWEHDRKLASKLRYARKAVQEHGLDIRFSPNVKKPEVFAMPAED